MSATLMCSLFTIAFQFDKNGVQWFWTGREIVSVIFGISAFVFGVLWLLESVEKKKKDEE